MRDDGQLSHDITYCDFNTALKKSECYKIILLSELQNDAQCLLSYLKSVWSNGFILLHF